jgi:hypothetical protein
MTMNPNPSTQADDGNVPWEVQIREFAKKLDRLTIVCFGRLHFIVEEAEIIRSAFAADGRQPFPMLGAP